MSRILRFSSIFDISCSCRSENLYHERFLIADLITVHNIKLMACTKISVVRRTQVSKLLIKKLMNYVNIGTLNMFQFSVFDPTAILSKISKMGWANIFDSMFQNWVKLHNYVRSNHILGLLEFSHSKLSITLTNTFTPAAQNILGISRNASSSIGESLRDDDQFDMTISRSATFSSLSSTIEPASTNRSVSTFTEVALSFNFTLQQFSDQETFFWSHTKYANMSFVNNVSASTYCDSISSFFLKTHLLRDWNFISMKDLCFFWI